MSKGKIEFMCPHCNKWMAVSAENAGQQMECPHPDCGGIIIIPSEGAQKQGSGASIFDYAFLFIIMLLLGATVWSFLEYQKVQDPGSPPKKPDIMTDAVLCASPGDSVTFSFNSGISSIGGYWALNTDLKNPVTVSIEYIDTAGKKKRKDLQNVRVKGEKGDVMNMHSVQDVPSKSVSGSISATIPEDVKIKQQIIIKSRINVIYPIKMSLGLFRKDSDNKEIEKTYLILSKTEINEIHKEYENETLKYKAKVAAGENAKSRSISFLILTIIMAMIYVGVILFRTLGRGRTTS